MGFKKLFKKVRKGLGLPALTLGTAAKIGAVAATGGVGAAGLALGTAALKSKLKSAATGGIKRVLRTKAEKANAQKIAILAPPKVVDIKASTMPGGAPLRTIKGVAVRRARKAASSPKPKAPRRARKASGGAKRSPPKGGKDLKALSASWKAAGKPGRWIDWVKSH